MPRAKWTDISSYSQRSNDRVPNCFTLNLGGLRMRVFRGGHDYPPGVWLTTCYGVFEHHQLLATDIVVAQREAVDFLRAWLSKVKSQLPL